MVSKSVDMCGRSYLLLFVCMYKTILDPELYSVIDVINASSLSMLLNEFYPARLQRHVGSIFGLERCVRLVLTHLSQDEAVLRAISRKAQSRGAGLVG